MQWRAHLLCSHCNGHSSPLSPRWLQGAFFNLPWLTFALKEGPQLCIFLLHGFVFICPVPWVPLSLALNNISLDLCTRYCSSVCCGERETLHAPSAALASRSIFSSFVSIQSTRYWCRQQKSDPTNLPWTYSAVLKQLCLLSTSHVHWIRQWSDQWVVPHTIEHSVNQYLVVNNVSLPTLLREEFWSSFVGQPQLESPEAGESHRL